MQQRRQGLHTPKNKAILYIKLSEDVVKLSHFSPYHP